MQGARTIGAFFDEAAARHPDRPYLIWTPDGSTTTYGQMRDRSRQVAQAWHEAGVRRGDRVAFLVDNSPEFLFAWFGLARIGAVLVAVNTGLTPREAAFVVGHAGARWLLSGPDHVQVATEVAERLDPTPVVVRLGGAGDDLLSRADTLEPRPWGSAPAPEDTASLIYTSGTTGRPKGVMQPHRNFVLTGEAYPTWMGMGEGERIYACLPLFHINSQAYAAMGAVGASGTLVLAPRFSARRFWTDVRAHRANVFNFIGAMSVVLSKKPPSPDDRDNDVRVAYGVPSLPDPVRRGLEERFDLRIISGFGMSETTFGLVEPLDDPLRSGSMGLPRHHPDPSVPRTEARIVAESGRVAPDGTVGELQLRNAAMMTGYFRDPEATAAALTPEGWLRTGDAAFRDGDGYFHFVDRVKDIVRRRGENISPLEVERVLNEHEAVLESAVTGVPSELTDEELFAYVVLREGRSVTAAELLAWCEDRLASFKIPRYLQFVDRLPKTSTSKVQKHLLPGLEGDTGGVFDRETRQ